MIILLGAILFVGFIVLVEFSINRKFQLMIAAIFFNILIIIVIMHLLRTSTVLTNTTETYLCSMSNNSNIDGSFFLGSGVVEGKNVIKYIYYPDSNNKSRTRIGMVDADENTTIIQKNGAQPVLKTIYRYKKYIGRISTQYYEFIVPVGSVRENLFVIDVTK